MVQLLAVGQVALFLAIHRQVPPSRQIQMRGAYIVLSAALVYVHYTAGLLLAAQMVVFACCRRIPRGYSGRQMRVDYLIIAALCLPTVPHLLEIGGNRQQWARFVRQPELFDLWSVFPLGTYVVVPSVLLAADRCTMANDRPERPQARLFCYTVVGWLVIPPLIAWVLTATDFARLFHRRYVMASATAAMLVSGACWALCRTRWSRAALAVGVLGCSLWGNGVWTRLIEEGHPIPLRNQNWRAAVGLIDDENTGLPVLIRSNLLEADRLPGNKQLQEYCVLPAGGLYRLRGNALQIPLRNQHPERFSRGLDERLKSAGGCWLLLGARPARGKEIADLISQRLSGGEYRGSVAILRAFGNVTAARITVSK